MQVLVRCMLSFVAIILAISALLSPTSVCMAFEEQAQSQLPRTTTNPTLYETYWAYSYSVPDENTYACQDFVAVELAVNDFRRAYEVEGGIVYSLSLEEQAIDLLSKEEDAICNDDSSILSTWPDIPTWSNGTAFGIGWRAANRTMGEYSYKCVQAVNFWAAGLPKIENTSSENVNWSSSVGPAAASMLLWPGGAEMGCAMRLCTGNEKPQDNVEQYVIYCIFSEAFAEDRDEVYEQLRKKLAASGRSCVPEVYFTKEGDRPSTIESLYRGNRGLTQEHLMCYHNQYSPKEIKVEGIPLAIPCKDDDVPDSCLETDLLSKGTGEGACPSLYRAVPGDTMKKIAEYYQGITAEDLCCFNPLFNNTDYGYCDKIPYLEGATSVVLIPCADDMRLRNCSNSAAEQEVISCPDANNTKASLNIIRESYGLPALQWSDELEYTLREGISSNFDNLCYNPFVPSFNYTEVPAANEFQWWVTALYSTITDIRCTPGMLTIQAVVNQLSDYVKKYELSEHLSDSALFYYANILLSGDVTSFACALQVCGAYYVNEYCAFDGSDVATTTGGEIENLKALPKQPECPRLVFPLEGDTYKSIADASNVTLQEVVCFYDYAQDVKNSDVRWSLGAPVVIPCSDKDPDTLTCEAYEVYLAETGTNCGFNYTVLPGETYDSIVKRFPKVNYTGCELCCYNEAGDGNCDPSVGDSAYIPCNGDLASFDFSTCGCMGSNRSSAHPVEKSGGSNTGMIVAIAVSVGVVVMLLLGGAMFMFWKRRKQKRHEALIKAPSMSSRPASRSSKHLESLGSNSWVVPGNELQIGRQIGGGSFGEVYLGRLRDGPVAIKCLHERNFLKHLGDDAVDKKTEKHFRALSREIELMTKIRSPYCVMYLGVCLDPLACITEYCALGSLYDLLKKASDHPSVKAKLTWDTRLKMTLNGALGMLHLHSQNIVHRDLKSPNLMVDDSYKVKVGDFGLSVFTQDAAIEAAHMTGGSTLEHLNRRWMAPEVSMALMSQNPPKQPFTPAADVYSFGLVLLEMATFKIPFHELREAQVMVSSSQGQLIPEFPEDELVVGGWFPGLQQYRKLMEDCCQQDPAKRPTFSGIVASIRAILKESKRKSRTASDSLGPSSVQSLPTSATTASNSREQSTSQTPSTNPSTHTSTTNPSAQTPITNTSLDTGSRDVQEDV